MNDFWCCDCRCVVCLSRHGRCERCNSDAVTIAAPPRMEPDMYQLEMIFRSEMKGVTK